MLGFVIFRSDNLKDAILYLQYLFSPTSKDSLLYGYKYFLNGDFVAVSIFGLIASTPLIKILGKNIFKTNMMMILKDIGLIILFIFSISYIISSTYSPFIYFQF